MRALALVTVAAGCSTPGDDGSPGAPEARAAEGGLEGAPAPRVVVGTSALIASGSQCWAIGDRDNELHLVTKTDFNPVTNETTIGAIGVPDVEALAFEPLTGVIYAANLDQLGRVNNDTGVFTALPMTMGTGTGAAGTLAFVDIDGLTFDAATGFLYAALRRDTQPDVLFRVNPTTGQRVANAFGAGVDYVVVPATAGLADLDDIAIDPGDGQMYAIANNGGTGDRMVRINKATGAPTDIGPLGVADMEGLGYDAAGNMWGTTGSGQLGLYEISKTTGAATNRRPLDNDGDYEAVDCFTVPSTDLAITAVPSDPRPNPGETFTYTVTVRNNGPHAAMAVAATFAVPAGVTYGSHVASAGAYVPGTGAWTIGDLAVGAQVTLVVTVAVDAATPGGTVVNAPATVAVPATSQDPRPLNNTATAVITINRPPIAVADAFTVAEDSTTALTVRANDTFAPDVGETLTVVAVGPAGNGAVVISGGGATVTYTPNPNFVGTDTFTYTISDGNGATASALVTVTVTPVNDTPVAVPDTATTFEDNAILIVVRANDTGLGDAPITTTATDPPNGSAFVDASGAITYVPDPNFSGVDTFTYTVTDADGQTATATVTVTVTAVNDTPVAAPDTATVLEDSGGTVNDVRANDTGLGDAPITTTATDPPNGSVVVNASGTITYTPDPNFSGVDTFTYTVTDADGQTATATVTVTVTPVNDTPVAAADAATVLEDSAGTVIAVRANDTGLGDAPITTTATDPPNGSVVVNADGTITYRPDPDFRGTDTFTYTVTDADGQLATATVTVTVTPVNDTPVAVADAATVLEDSGGTAIDVRGNDTGLGDAPITTTATDPPNGSVVVNADGSITYTPDPGFSGTDTFTYTVTDADGQLATATVTVTVTAVDDTPVAMPDTATTPEDTVALIDVRANDTGLGDVPITTTATDPPNGSAIVNPDGTISYAPDPNFSGTDTFSYTVTDADGQLSTATVTVTVTPVNDTPVAVADAATVLEDSGGTVIDVRANDTGLGDAPITTTATDPPNGSVVVNANGTITYTPDPDFRGTDTFTYTVTDADGQLSTATVTVTVTEVNDTPVAVADVASTPQDTAVVIDVRANDTGLGDTPIATTATDPPNGSVVVNADGSITYTPDAGFTGTDTFSYTVRDADGQMATATVTVAVGNDRDGDGLTDDDEEAIGSDPDDADSDDDGVIDGDEPDPGADTDGDGVINALDPDSDNDGVLDGTETGVTVPHPDTDVGNGHFVPDADPTTTTDPLDPDTDGGGVADGAEDSDHDGQIDPGERDPNDPADDVTPPADDDGDGLSNDEEVAIGTDPQDADSDDDGVIDGDEPNYSDDTDGDGLINPLDPDSDDDGIFDGTETGVTTPHPDTDVGNGHFVPDADPSMTTSPIEPDTDGGGVPDGAEDSDHDGQIDPGEGDPNDPADDVTPPADDDGDGLSNDEEEAIGTDPQDADSDDDGVLDGDEPNYTDDTDGDGLINPLDPDSDNDGIFDGTESGVTTPHPDTDLGAGNFVPDADPTTTTSPVDPDTDDGGVTDGAEDADHDGQIDPGETDPNDPADDSTVLDDDADGLSNAEEADLGTDPQDADSDDDGVIDGDEANPSDDTDGDGLINPLDPDSDDDGILDGTEAGVTTPHPDTDVGAGNFVPDADPSTTTSPVDPDTDDGGVPDGDEDTDHDGQIDPGETDPNDPADDATVVPDLDGDGVPDSIDNCPRDANGGQDDEDGDGDGDLCDDDIDGDGFLNGYGVSGGGCAAGGGDRGGLALALLGLGVVLARRRRSRRRGAAVGAALVATLIAAGGGAAQAQVTTERKDFSVERFGLSSGRGGILAVESAALTRRWDWEVHLWLGTADDPLVVFMQDGDDHERVGALVSQRTGGELGGSVVLHERLGLGLDVPLIVAQDRAEVVQGVDGMLAELGGVGLGDLRLTPKLRVLRQHREGVDLAVIPELVLPTSSGEDYRGDAGTSFAPYLALSRQGDRVRWAVNAGYAFRRGTSVGGLVVDNELRARAGVGVRVARTVELDGTLAVATAAKAPFDDFARNHLELIGGPALELAGQWTLFAAGGVGLREGYGTPDWRALAGVRVRARDDRGAIDLDGDGLIATDRCPREPEDVDTFEDADGCPDPDNDADLVLDVDDGAPLDPEDRDDFEDTDGVPDPDNDRDGILDGDDRCVLEPETANNFQDEDGCPDVLDSDGDGMNDMVDQCPAVPEDVDGFVDTDGCPEDNDGDGLVDVDDGCPDEAGRFDNRGCPDKDRDGDTVVDRADNCPDEPGTVANHGCKDKQLAVLTGTGIEIIDVVYFKTDKDVIQKRSWKLLTSVANVIRNHPELPLIVVEGHTDDVGDDAYNLDLSQRRAAAVRAFLIGKGIDGARLEARGFGETRPLIPKTDKKSRAANRRVEFKIDGVRSQQSGPTDDTIGK